MLSFIDPNPLLTVLWIAAVAGLVVLSIVLWYQLQHRARRYGGGNIAAAVMAAAVVALLVSITPNFLPMEIGLVVLVFAFVAIYRPEQVIKLTGGPSLRWRALREGRELQLLVRQRGGPSLAKRNPEVQERFEALSELEGPETAEYIGLLRETLLADSAEPGMAEKLEQMAQADAALRASLRARPTWERDLEKRAAELTPADGAPTGEAPTEGEATAEGKAPAEGEAPADR